jgi:mycothiol system anti-sigma-R factor
MLKILSGCREVTKLFDAFVDDELMSAAQSRVRYHIASCGSCAAFVEEKIELKRLVKGSVGNMSAPSSLRDRLWTRMRM